MILLESFARRQKQVFPDSADLGVSIVGDTNKDVREGTRLAIVAMKPFLISLKPTTMGFRWTFWIPIEEDAGVELGYRIIINWFHCRHPQYEYLSFDLRNGIPKGT
jgi:hypothetical protein